MPTWDGSLRSWQTFGQELDVRLTVALLSHWLDCLG